jgi:two-component system sensor histidine kinase YesM
MISLDDFKERAGVMRRFLISMFITGLILSIFIAFFLSAKSYRPLQNILTILKNADNSAAEYPVQKGGHMLVGGEVKYILSNISKSINTTKEQELELKSRMELLNKAQVAALMAQINPHFVHNTLETINIKAVRLGGYNNDVSKMVVDLSSLLRLSLESDKHIATVAEEVEHVKLYLRIMEQRFEGRFVVEWNIDPSIIANKVLKICLQPVVENAISHGMKPLKRVCRISISGWREQNGIVLEVKDDGVGMHPKALESLRLNLNEIYIIKGHSVGLGNISQRIKLIYGEGYGVSVESVEDVGTTVHLSFPSEL